MELTVKRSIRPTRQLLRIPVNIVTVYLRVPLASYSGSFVAGDTVKKTSGTALLGVVTEVLSSTPYVYLTIEYRYSAGTTFTVGSTITNQTRTGSAVNDQLTFLSESNTSYNSNYTGSFEIGDSVQRSGANPPFGTVIYALGPYEGYEYLLVELDDDQFLYTNTHTISNTTRAGSCKPSSVSFDFTGTAVETDMFTLPIDADTKFFREFMGAHKITVVSVVYEPIALRIGDYIEYEGMRYSIKRPPKVEKYDNSTYEYTVIFYAPASDLYDRLISDEGSTNFSYTGTPEEVLQLILDSMSSQPFVELDYTGSTGIPPATYTMFRSTGGAVGLMYTLGGGKLKLIGCQGTFAASGKISGGGFSATITAVTTGYLESEWTAGTVEDLDPKTITFADQSCRTALAAIAEAFELEWVIADKEISLVAAVGVEVPLAFTYGRNNACKRITRYEVEEEFTTIWHGYGSSQNIPSSYRNNLGRLSFDANPIYKNSNIYGEKHGVVVFDDVYPKFEGVAIVALDPTISFTIWAAMDFDVNDYVLVDGSAKVVFLTGDLAGNEFTITSFTLSLGVTGIFNLEPITEENGYELPNSTVKAAIGDTFTIIGISMPDSYVTDAEALLEEKTIAFAEANSGPKVSFEVIVNENWVLENDPTITPGDDVFLSDVGVEWDDYIQVQSVEYPLVEPTNLKLILSDSTLTVATRQGR